MTARVGRNPAWIPLGLLVVAVVLLLCGCGKKGPPIPPQALIPPPVSDLEAGVFGRTVRLSWSIPGPVEAIKHFKVYAYRVRSSSPPCPGCPLSFHELVEIDPASPSPGRVRNGRVTVSTGFDPQFRYGFKVVVIHKTGGVSEDSNIVYVP
ncbi:MAG: hypothetical protein JRI36_05105 [Deltaproteobacteria bacterium]|nr:hypothetical protein [Deltaproteobacteria bacterium]